MKIKSEDLKQSYDPKPKLDAKVTDVILETGIFSIWEFKSSLTSSFKFCSCALRSSLLVFCLLAIPANAKISSEQLNPIDLLTPHFALTSQDVDTPNAIVETSQDVNTQNVIVGNLQDVNMPNVPWDSDTLLRLWEPLIQLINFQSDPQEQLQISDIANVNSATEATHPSGLKEPLARSAEGEVSFLTKWPDTSASAKDDSKISSQLSQDSLSIAQSSNNHPAHQLWQARISISDTEDDKKSKQELQRIIEQVRSIEFEQREETSKPVIVVEPAPTPEPNETSPATEVPQEHKEKKIELKLPYEPLTKQTLQILKSLLQHPEQLNKPFELGELLFLSGHLKDAAICYQEALSRSSPDKNDPNQKPQQDGKVPDVGLKTVMFSIQNRAWILFQIGNCLRDDDPKTAMKMYKQLIAEYPDSPWADLAKARIKLIDWYQKDNPRVLIAEDQF